MSRRTPYLILPAIVLLLIAAALVRMRRTADTPRTGEPALRVAALSGHIEAFLHVDDPLILYEEINPIIPTGFNRIAAIAVGPDDRIYAADGRHVAVFSPRGAERARRTLDAPITCLAVDEDGFIYAGHGRAVHAYNTDGMRTAVFSGIGSEAIVTSVAAADGRVFVADAQGRTAMIFSADGVLQTVIDGRSASGNERGFLVPSPYFDLVPGQGRTLWVANPGRHRVEEYTHEGIRIHAWEGAPGLDLPRFAGCCNPSHIARLSDGSLVTSEKGISRVKLYSRRGEFRGVVAPPRAFDSPTLSLDLAVDSDDRILVADPARVQVRIFVRR